VLNHVDTQRLDQDGFAIVADCLDDRCVDDLCSSLSKTEHGQRNLLRVPIVRGLAASEPVRHLVTAVLGKNCFAVRAILFNKTPTVVREGRCSTRTTPIISNGQDAGHTLAFG
jgi:hypothetical protein